MTGAVDTTPAATQASMIRAVLAEQWPKLALPTIAHHYSVQLNDLQAILNRAGYPSVARMRTALAVLESPTATQAPAADTTTGAEADAEDTREILTKVPVSRLRPDPDNIRENLTDIEDLATSMVEVGLLQPIIARRSGTQLYVVAGHRRLAAAKHLKWTEIDCIIRAAMRPDHVLAAMLIENGQRADLDPLEEARGFNRLKQQLDGCSDTTLARKVGRSQVYVSSRLALLGLTAEEQDEVRAGTMALVEATHRGRLNAGKVRATGVPRGWHLGPAHDLATKAKARCQRLKHPRGRTVGGMACGECWESVIRADERQHLHDQSDQRGRCVLCDTNHETSTR